LFDTRRRPLQLTAFARDVAAAAQGLRLASYQHGWWREPARLHYPPVDEHGRDITAPAESAA
jgi:hypothetical protein